MAMSAPGGYEAQQQPLQKLLGLQDRRGERAYQAAASRYQRAKLLGISAIGAAMIVGAVLGWMLLRSMLVALAHAVATSERIASGQLGHATATTVND
jgi:methyl-accepting chemotaxis protein